MISETVQGMKFGLRTLLALSLLLERHFPCLAERR